jgi:diguanylate cyclase (GGDEF)-like protein
LRNGVLVVDDEETLRIVLAEVLTSEGHEVSVAKNAEDALQQFRVEPFPIVITDIIMGEMNGIDLLKEIKLIEPETEVIVMTSDASLETATDALRCGAYDYLTKPFDELDLITAVANRAFETIRLRLDNQRLLETLRKDAEELEKLNRQLRDSVRRDGLTGLFNHKYFRETLRVELSRCLRYERECSLIFIDVDNFKCYNDTNGHPAGDEVLKNLAQQLHDGRRSATTVARYGGEEFVILLPETGKHGAISMAEKLRRSVEETDYPFADKQPLGRLTLSLGVASFPEDGSSEAEILDRADKALYRAKEGGRNRVCSASSAIPMEKV